MLCIFMLLGLNTRIIALGLSFGFLPTVYAFIALNHGNQGGSCHWVSPWGHASSMCLWLDLAPTSCGCCGCRDPRSMLWNVKGRVKTDTLSYRWSGLTGSVWRIRRWKGVRQEFIGTIYSEEGNIFEPQLDLNPDHATLPSQGVDILGTHPLVHIKQDQTRCTGVKTHSHYCLQEATETTKGRSRGRPGEYLTGQFPGEEGDAPILISDPHFYHQHHHGRDIRTVDSTLHQSVRCKTTSSLYQRRPTCLSHPTSHYLYWSCLWRASLRAHRLPRTFACSGDVCDSLAGAWLAPARRGRPSSVCTTLLPSLFDGTSSPRIGQLSSLSFAVFHGEEAMYFSNHHCNISDAFAPSRYSGEEMWRPQRYDGWRRAEHSGDSNFYWMADRQGPSVSTIYQLSSM